MDRLAGWCVRQSSLFSSLFSSSSSRCLLQALRQHDVSTNVCRMCLRPIGRRQFTSSLILRVSCARNSTKKIVKPIQLGKQKSSRKLKEVVTIRPEMTVIELATVLNRTTDQLFEAIGYISEPLRIRRQPDSLINNVKAIQQIVDKCGFRWKMESSVVQQQTSAQSKDVFRRKWHGGKSWKDYMENSWNFIKALPPEPTDKSILVKRPPIVTIMGHVDHGKTTLLDALRHSRIVDQEFGGITQHIGAFSVVLSGGERLTFLDTPGHAAFSAMRARGASCTDIVVLVIAADDGVMKQTVESLQCVQDAGVPIIVAINKIDKSDSDIESTKRDLVKHGIELEDFGGDVQAIPISALKKQNLDALQEAIVALAEVLEIRADPDGPVEAVVIESRTDPGRGKLSTALIQRGTLKKGDVLVCGTAWAKVRGMFNDEGRPVVEASPGTAVEIIGWRELPSAGKEILQVESERRAREVVEYRQSLNALDKMMSDSLEIERKAEVDRAEYVASRQKRLQSGIRFSRRVFEPRKKESDDSSKGPELAIVIKGDVDGSVEAILDVLDSYQSTQCRLHLLSYGVGHITEQDIEMAAAFKGVVYGFNVPLNAKVSDLAKTRNVVISQHDIIYRLLDDLRERLTQRLPPVQAEDIIGEANVLADFTVTDGKKKVSVAGCRCIKGILNKKKLFKLLRNNVVLLEGELSSLKHFKTEVESIKTEVECGLSFTDQTVTPLPGDKVICFERRDKKQELDWQLDF